MKNTIALICFGIVVAGYLVVSDYYGSKSGAASSIQHCYDNSTEEPTDDCGARAAAFKKKYGHAFDE